MCIMFDSVERVGIFAYFIFHEAVKIFELAEAVSFPVVGAMNESVFQIAAVAAEVVKRKHKSLVAVQRDDW